MPHEQALFDLKAETLTGTLRAVHLDQNWLEVTIENKHIRSKTGWQTRNSHTTSLLQFFVDPVVQPLQRFTSPYWRTTEHYPLSQLRIRRLRATVEVRDERSEVFAPSCYLFVILFPQRSIIMENRI